MLLVLVPQASFAQSSCLAIFSCPNYSLFKLLNFFFVNVHYSFAQGFVNVRRELQRIRIEAHTLHCTIAEFLSTVGDFLQLSPFLCGTCCTCKDCVQLWKSFGKFCRMHARHYDLCIPAAKHFMSLLFLLPIRTLPCRCARPKPKIDYLHRFTFKYA